MTMFNPSFTTSSHITIILELGAKSYRSFVIIIIIFFAFPNFIIVYPYSTFNWSELEQSSTRTAMSSTSLLQVTGSEGQGKVF